jgi:class 3 adenylate cyclase
MSDHAWDCVKSALSWGATLFREGKFGDACSFYSEWIRENPECAEAYLGRGRCAAAIGEHEQALDDFNTALELVPNSAECLCARALSFAAQENHEAALADLDLSLALSPDLAEAYCSRAIEHLHSGHPAAALVDCTEAIKLQAGFAEAYYYRHLANVRLGHKDLADEDYEEARRLGFRGEHAAPADPSPLAADAPSTEPPAVVAEPDPEPEPVTAHVLFMDVVKSSQLSADGQHRTNARLKEVVANTRAFQNARTRDELISLPTGDGMALVFRNKFEAPLLCAIEIARTLQVDPFCRLRMGIHSGIVFLQRDINDNPNVTGPGINLAERVMSCGEEGHILVSGEAAELLRHLSVWSGKLEYLGEYRAKRDCIRVWNFLDGDIGNAAPLKSPSRAVQTS